MSGSLPELQAKLPRSFQLYRYRPDRPQFSWRTWAPSGVHAPEDLPPYILLGYLNPETFAKSQKGWSARWQGIEGDTHVDVAYKHFERRWEVRQTWLGHEGAFTIQPAQMPLDQVISQGLNLQFPTNWDRAAKTQLEDEYQLTVVEQPRDAYNLCGIPDGVFRSILIPMPVGEIRRFRDWLIANVQEILPAGYPVNVEAKILLQAVNYVEGKAPAWTVNDGETFYRSILQSGLAPTAMPVRETANDGSAAWTLRREIYFLLVGIPFAGLLDFVQRMYRSSGPIRKRSDPELPLELRPVVVPAGFELQNQSLSYWDSPRTTRSFISFGDVGDRPAVSADEPTGTGLSDEMALREAEAISTAVTAAIEGILKKYAASNDND